MAFGDESIEFADVVVLPTRINQDIYPTVAGGFVGDNDKFANKKQIPHMTKTNGVTHMLPRKPEDTSRSFQLQ